MELLEFGNPQNEIIILIHGLQTPYQIWNDYIEYFQKYYHVIVPVLPGHNLHRQDDFISCVECAKEIEDYCLDHYGSHIYGIYGLSMGGVIAGHILKNKRVKVNKVIFESSPLLPINPIIKEGLKKEYLYLTHQVQKDNQKVIQKAVGTIIRQELLDEFVALLKQMSDTTIKNCVESTCHFHLPSDLDTSDMELYYFYGDALSEGIYNKSARYIKKHYPHTMTICFDGEGHCYEALIDPQEHIKLISIVFKGDAIF